MSEHKPEKEIVLEIGVGANDFAPMPTMLYGVDGNMPRRTFVDGRHYIGIDMPSDEDRSWRAIHMFMNGMDDSELAEYHQTSGEIAGVFGALQQAARRYRPNESINFMVADATVLPIADESVSEVYMSNVVGSQMREGPLGAILREARRVLRPSSKLVIREDITPHWVPDDLDELVKDAGFAEGLTRHMRGSVSHDELSEFYGKTPTDIEDPRHQGFFAITEVR